MGTLRRVGILARHDTVVALKRLEGELFLGLDAFLAKALDFHCEDLLTVVFMVVRLLLFQEGWGFGQDLDGAVRIKGRRKTYAGLVLSIQFALTDTRTPPPTLRKRWALRPTIRAVIDEEQNVSFHVGLRI